MDKEKLRISKNLMIGIVVCCNDNKQILFEFDVDKRNKTLDGRGLDFNRVAEIFGS